MIGKKRAADERLAVFCRRDGKRVFAGRRIVEARRRMFDPEAFCHHYKRASLSFELIITLLHVEAHDAFGVSAIADGLGSRMLETSECAACFHDYDLT